MVPDNVDDISRREEGLVDGQVDGGVERVDVDGGARAPRAQLDLLLNCGLFVEVIECYIYHFLIIRSTKEMDKKSKFFCF